MEWALEAPSRRVTKVAMASCCCQWRTWLEGGFLGSLGLKEEEEQMSIEENRGALPFIKREAMEGKEVLYGKPRGHASHHGGCHGRPCCDSDRWDVHGHVSHLSGFEINKSLFAKTRGHVLTTEFGRPC